ncbi:MAG: hypothetical protein IKY18_06485 [Oscillospiraceae bacterium]|nr:hypothetical protein [Oscillospiraceae bacterium]
MYKVKNIATGEVRTVYALCGTMFLFHNGLEWHYDNMEYYMPVECCDFSMVSDSTKNALLQIGRTAHGGKDPGKKKQLTMEKALDLLNAEYEKAMGLEYIRNPLAYALYQVWKLADQKNGGADRGKA